MIDLLQLKFGASSLKPPLRISLSPVTVFVGPNNSGKSKILVEIEAACRTGSINLSTNLIVSSLSFSDVQDYEVEVQKIVAKHQLDNQGNFTLKKANTSYILNENIIRNILKNIGQNLLNFCQYYLDFKTLRIDGESRIRLINDQNAGDLQNKPALSFETLFRDINKRKETRRIIYDAFKKYFVVDPTKLGNFRVRLSDTEPKDELQECGIHEDAIKFHNQADLINQASDGVKAFIGIIISLIAGEPKVILIDEPEAFLHPSLAANLGKEVSNIVNGTDKNLLVSTHSSDFLMGCIQSGAPINIIRLTYLKKTPTARLLQSDKVLRLMRNPLLRSTGVLNGLFYENVIVTEADSDRAFYQEINERLLAFCPEKGIPNCLFLNAQNKQTIHEIIKPLREMGIPCAAILDIDVVKEGGKVWTNLLNAAFMPYTTVLSTTTSRGIIKSKFDEKGINFKVNGGVKVLDAPDQEACHNLFDQLDSYGIFTVRNGELESWLKNLNITSTHSPQWLIETFEKLGEDPTTNTYIKPANGDVWDFLWNIKRWFENPLRKGIPE